MSDIQLKQPLKRARINKPRNSSNTATALSNMYNENVNPNRLITTELPVETQKNPHTGNTDVTNNPEPKHPPIGFGIEFGGKKHRKSKKSRKSRKFKKSRKTKRKTRKTKRRKY